MKPRRLLKCARKSQQFAILEMPAQKSDADRCPGATDTIVVLAINRRRLGCIFLSQTVWYNDRRMSGEIRYGKLRARTLSQDDVIRIEDFLHLSNRQGPHAICLNVVNCRVETRYPKLVRPVLWTLLSQQLIAARQSEIIKGSCSLREQQRDQSIERKGGKIDRTGVDT